VNTSAWQHSLNMTSTFELSETLSIQWALNYLSDRITAQGRDSRFYNPSLTIKKDFMDKRLTTTLQWLSMDMGLLNANEQRITTWNDGYVDPDDGIKKAFFTTTNYVYEVDMIMLNVSYRISGLKNKSRFIKSEFGEKEF
jgi:hypothetical protein